MRNRAIWLGLIIVALGGMSRGQKTVQKAELLLSPGWQAAYDAYVPDPALIRELKLSAPGRRAAVYFGSWCDDSKKHVPVFLKIVDALDAPEFQVDFFAVEKKSPAGRKYYVESQRVEKVPTFIFYIGDAEIGRIIENPKESVLQDMITILQ
jgi:thiol-disulfide isomerase/thioredoxin